MVAPAKTPKEVVAKVNAALKRALSDSDVRKRIEDLGAIPPKPDEATAEWMDNFLRAEVDQWGKVVRTAGAKVE